MLSGPEANTKLTVQKAKAKSDLRAKYKHSKSMILVPETVS